MHTGRCLCGAVTYRITADPISARACWCRLCQYIGAGSATVNVAFRSEAIIIHGRLSDFPCDADSGSRMHRRFCPGVRTHLFSEAESRPHLIFVRAGSLDDPEIARPVATIWTSQAPSWAASTPTCPRSRANRLRWPKFAAPAQLLTQCRASADISRVSGFAWRRFHP